MFVKLALACGPIATAPAPPAELSEPMAIESRTPVPVVSHPEALDTALERAPKATDAESGCALLSAVAPAPIARQSSSLARQSLSLARQSSSLACQPLSLTGQALRFAREARRLAHHVCCLGCEVRHLARQASRLPRQAKRVVGEAPGRAREPALLATRLRNWRRSGQASTPKPCRADPQLLPRSRAALPMPRLRPAAARRRSSP